MDFAPPDDWQFGSDAYPCAPKRLVSISLDGKKKSNKHFGAHTLDRLLDQTVRLVATAPAAGTAAAAPGGPAAGQGPRGHWMCLPDVTACGG